MIKTWWSNLGERDRYVLCIGGAICFVYIFYMIVFSPLIRAVDFKSHQLIEKKETLDWIRKQINIKPTQKRIEGNLLSVFSGSLKRASFANFPYKLQQAGEDNIQLVFDEVPYGEFLIWLKNLNEHYTMTISELSAIRTATPGIVKLHVVVLSRAMESKR